MPYLLAYSAILRFVALLLRSLPVTLLTKLIPASAISLYCSSQRESSLTLSIYSLVGGQKMEMRMLSSKLNFFSTTVTEISFLMFSPFSFLAEFATVAVIVVLPTALAVITPFSSTEAIAGSALSQLTL